MVCRSGERQRVRVATITRPDIDGSIPSSCTRMQQCASLLSDPPYIVKGITGIVKRRKNSDQIVQRTAR